MHLYEGLIVGLSRKFVEHVIEKPGEPIVKQQEDVLCRPTLPSTEQTVLSSLRGDRQATSPGPAHPVL